MGVPDAIQRHVAPLDAELVRQLCQLWQDTFQVDYAPIGRVVGGSEHDTNLDIVYFVQDGGEIVATTHLTVSRRDPRIGGLGEVATVPAQRGRGLAGALCRQAAEEFDGAGGEGLFLGTANPGAARVYQRLGWENLPHTNVMLRPGSSAFIEEYFRNGAGQPVEIAAGDSAQRVTLIPLILAGHDSVVLDANTELYAVHARHQKSCMSLYPRYESLAEEGAWFAATRQDGAVVGLSSARRLDEQAIQIDAFAHSAAGVGVTADLLGRAADWAASQPGAVVQAICATADQRRRELLTELNLRPTGRQCSLAGSDGEIDGEVFASGKIS